MLLCLGMNRKLICLIVILNLLSAQFFMTQNVCSVRNDFILRKAIGHDFTEELWAVEYDFRDKYVKNDVTGNFQSKTIDNKTEDDTFYIVYSNKYGIEMAYIALEYILSDEKISWMPLQTILQHWQTPNEEEIYVKNTFASLIAYDDIDNSKYPSFQDKLYIGWTFYQNEILDVLNEELEIINFSVENNPDKFVEIIEPDEINNQIKFGIKYKGIFTVWQDIEVYNDYSNIKVIPNGVRAITYLEDLTFEYSYEIKRTSENRVEAIMSVNYNIGQVSQMVIFGDTKTQASIFNGTHGKTLNSGYNYAVYNTSDSISGRLNGSLTKSIPGMGLSMLSYVNTLTMSEITPSYQDETGESITQDTEKPISAIDIVLDDRKIFNTNFKTKSNYSLHDEGVLLKDNLDVDSRVIKRTKVENNYFKSQSGSFSSLINSFEQEQETLNIEKASYCYLVSFPEWNGYEIRHDPVFTAFAEYLTRYPWILMIGGIGIVSIALLAITSMIRKKKELIQKRK